jgi:hypothetical protein
LLSPDKASATFSVALIGPHRVVQIEC